MKLKNGDNVMIISGKDRGKTGKILRVLTKANKVVVEKANIITKHIKKTKNRRGEIIKFEAPIHASNVMLISPDGSGPTRIGYKKLENGEKVRIAKRSKEVIEDKKVIKKK